MYSNISLGKKAFTKFGVRDPEGPGSNTCRTKRGLWVRVGLDGHDASRMIVFVWIDYKGSRGNNGEEKEEEIKDPFCRSLFGQTGSGGRNFLA